ncbi:2-amino-4-hydroxy-6-hydroxymethyldihydropteridine diphosphokinase [Helicobacter saguini]|nr:2-amino-4-hydroxy-6-hydroxymethyldihydropteridine diphosphokinase [Helicobacter saguini]
MIKYFPYECAFSDRFYKNLVILGIGSNMGNTFKIFRNLFLSLKNNKLIKLFSTSHIYKNKAFGYTKQPDFYNATIILSTNLCLRNFYALMFYLERKLGRSRKRAFKNAPRKIDIDLIYFDKKRANLKHLSLPHKDFHNRESVLKPLSFQMGLE